MKELIVLTREELVEIIDDCFARHLPTIKEPVKQPEQKLLYSLKELADFLGCSVVTAQHLKNNGRIRYKQFGRKLIFNTQEVLEDISNSQNTNFRKAIARRHN